MKKNTSEIHFGETFISLCNGCILFIAPLEKYIEKAPLRAKLAKVKPIIGFKAEMELNLPNIYVLKGIL